LADSDESNIGLHSRLGMEKPEDFMNYFGGKKLLFEKTKEMKNKWRLDDLPGDYLAEKGNIQLLSMGKIYEFGEGCACPINALSSKFLEILDLGDEEFLIADTDAGIEHFGRGVEKGADILFVIIDPSRESILLAEKIPELGKQADKPVYYILNRIANQETEEFLRDSPMGRSPGQGGAPVGDEGGRPMGLAWGGHIGVASMNRQEKSRDYFTISEHIPPVRYRRSPNNQKHPDSATTSGRKHSSR